MELKNFISVSSFCPPNFFSTYTFSAISNNFWGGCQFYDEWVLGKGVVSPPQWGPGAKTWKIFHYFAFWIAQSIAHVALQQRTLMKAYTRNQYFWEIGGEFEIPNWYVGFRIAVDTALTFYYWRNHWLH